jgi:hypothetical protein
MERGTVPHGTREDPIRTGLSWWPPRHRVAASRVGRDGHIGERAQDAAGGEWQTDSRASAQDVQLEIRHRHQHGHTTAKTGPDVEIGSAFVGSSGERPGT